MRAHTLQKNDSSIQCDRIPPTNKEPMSDLLDLDWTTTVNLFMLIPLSVLFFQKMIC